MRGETQYNIHFICYATCVDEGWNTVIYSFCYAIWVNEVWNIVCNLWR